VNGNGAHRSALLDVVLYCRDTDEGAQLEPPTRWVAVTLASYVNSEGCAWPSQKRLTEATGYSERTVRRALEQLCNGPAPLFERTHEARRTVYRLVRSTLRHRSQWPVTTPTPETAAGHDADTGHSGRSHRSQWPVTPVTVAGPSVKVLSDSPTESPISVSTASIEGTGETPTPDPDAVRERAESPEPVDELDESSELRASSEPAEELDESSELRASSEPAELSRFTPDPDDTVDDSPIAVSLANGARNFLTRELEERWPVAGPHLAEKIRTVGLMKASRLPLFEVPEGTLVALGQLHGVAGLFVAREESGE
jgi:hypothetical protein